MDHSRYFHHSAAIRAALMLLLVAASALAPARAAADFTAEEQAERLKQYAGFAHGEENCVDRTAETIAKLGGWALIVASATAPPATLLGQAVGSLLTAFPPDHLCFCQQQTRSVMVNLDSGGEIYSSVMVISVSKLYCVRTFVARSKALSVERPCYHPQPDEFPGWVITPDGLEDDCQ
jgi:hypothetical protein